jgi:radical SAM superfamily enzyme YgiQ (UPF0313 family)
MPQVLGKINKGIDRAQTVQAIDMTSRCGIRSLGFFMVASPGDTEESILASIEFAKELKLDFIQVCRCIAKPGTELHGHLIETRHSDYWREYILGKVPEEPLPTPWSGLSDADAKRYMRKFYKEFYFRPSYILKLLGGARSPAELARYAGVAAKWLKNEIFK